MPFLVKVLAVDRPLSLQVHPDEASAGVGYRREDVGGVLVDDPRRCFPDGRAKPEAVCAVGQFETLCGFRPISEALEMAAALRLPERVLGPL
ncbi:MAG: type I phosphomannose isomerase catalytic subunit, partial [Actinomycetota bacterium]|nr:type I phosphomannose isomerase catalytic subunit [Actinomycetota bacterium]